MSDVLRAALDPMVLALLDQQPDHGYSILQRLRGTVGLEIRDGSLYPCLYRLEEAGKIIGAWETSDAGRERKVFRITPKGRRGLLKTKAEWPQLVRAMNDAFGINVETVPTLR